MSVSRQMKSLTRPGTKPARYIAGRIISRKPGEDESLSKVRRWVHKCDEKHEQCKVFSAEAPLPSRVLNIESKPTVHVTNGEHGHYIALSYCWGENGKNTLLTSSSFTDFTSTGIDLDALPRTIQDAIIVTKTLGIKYIWIDALCIIQQEPDLKDFIIEAPKMAEYYSNAYLTLIVGSAHSCTDGFLQERSPLAAPPCEIAYNRIHAPDPDSSSDNKDELGSVYLSLSSPKAMGHITTRAWTYQELFLSSRYVVYGASQLSFRCPQYEAYENGDFRAVASLDADWSSSIVAPPSLHDVLACSDAPRAMDYAYKKWYASISAYTGRDMTNEADKLAAIAGVAKLVQKAVRCKYLYGLWENDLVRGLLWRVPRPWASPPSRRAPVKRVLRRAPSWSWASIDGMVHMASRPSTGELYRVPEDLPLKIVSHEGISDELIPIREKIDIPKAFELRVKGRIRLVWHMPFLWSGKQGFPVVEKQPVYHRTEKYELAKQWKDAYVAIGSWDTMEEYNERSYWGHQVYALLLTASTGLLLMHDDGRYRRVGHFWSANEEFFNGLDDEECVLI
jgi:Heterokaryon incompatibility protein (HET)